MTKTARPLHAVTKGGHTPLTALGAVLLVTLTARCASHSDSSPPAIKSDSAGRASSATGSSGSGSLVALGGLGGFAPSADSAGSPGSASSNGGSSGSGGVAVLYCGQGGGAGEAPCEIPRSACRDDGQTLVYYSDPHCVDGACEVTESTLQCRTRCNLGACELNVTAK